MVEPQLGVLLIISNHDLSLFSRQLVVIWSQFLQLFLRYLTHWLLVVLVLEPWLNPNLFMRSALPEAGLVAKALRRLSNLWQHFMFFQCQLSPLEVCQLFHMPTFVGHR